MGMGVMGVMGVFMVMVTEGMVGVSTGDKGGEAFKMGRGVLAGIWALQAG